MKITLIHDDGQEEYELNENVEDKDFDIA